MTDTATRAHNWVVGDDCGISSRAIWANMMGVEPGRGDWGHPWDPADLGRCLRLLELIPEWKGRLPEMAQRSPAWAKLIDKWELLEASMAGEVGIDWSKSREAPNTYDLMKAVLGRHG